MTKPTLSQKQQQSTQTFPTLIAEFPNMPLESLSPIPQGWVDTSWHNDVSPSFQAYTRPDGAYIRAWIDFPNQADRKLGGKRYTASWYDASGDPMEDFWPFVQTDDWSVLLAAVAAEIAKWSMQGLGYELKHTGGGYMAHARTFGAHEVLVTSTEGGLPVSESEPIYVGLYDDNHEEEINLREFPDMPSARHFLIELARFVEHDGGAVEKFSWKKVTPRPKRHS